MATAPQLRRALTFGTLPPDQIPFTMVTTPSLDVERLGENDPLPKDNFLTPLFRENPYRNVRIHFWIDPQYLKFARTADGLYADDLQCVGMVYRDDGVQANSLSFSEHLQISEEAMADALNSGINFDETIAVPVAGNPLPGSFFLRVAITEKASGRIGAIEIPAEWIRNPETSTAQAAQTSFVPDTKR